MQVVEDAAAQYPAPTQFAVPTHAEHTQQIKDLTEMLMRKLNMAAMKGGDQLIILIIRVINYTN